MSDYVCYDRSGQVVVHKFNSRPLRMYASFRGLLQVLWVHLLCGWVLGSELTFELPDNAKQCFHEDIIMGTKCTLEFQVGLFFDFYTMMKILIQKA